MRSTHTPMKTTAHSGNPDGFHRRVPWIVAGVCPTRRGIVQVAIGERETNLRGGPPTAWLGPAGLAMPFPRAERRGCSLVPSVDVTRPAVLGGIGGHRLRQGRMPGVRPAVPSFGGVWPPPAGARPLGCTAVDREALTVTPPLAQKANPDAARDGGLVPITAHEGRPARRETRRALPRTGSAKHPAAARMAATLVCPSMNGSAAPLDDIAEARERGR